MDLIEDLALPLPVTVISELLGLPIEDQAQAREWAEAIAQALDPIVTEEQARRADRAVKELAAYIGDVVARRRRNPGPDLLSRLVEAEDEGGHLSEAELISTVGLLFGAGHETTRNLIGNGMLALLRNPAELQRLRNDPSLIRTAVEELLRYDSPVQIAGRGARADAVIGGERIAAGEPLMLLVGAANRDPAQFPDPDRLDVGRPDVKMLSFGGGIHFCLGAMLARTEGQIAIGDAAGPGATARAGHRRPGMAIPHHAPGTFLTARDRRLGPLARSAVCSFRQKPLPAQFLTETTGVLPPRRRSPQATQTGARDHGLDHRRGHAADHPGLAAAFPHALTSRHPAA